MSARARRSGSRSISWAPRPQAARIKTGERYRSPRERPEQELGGDARVGRAEAVANLHARGELLAVDEVVAGVQRASERGRVVPGEQGGEGEPAEHHAEGETRTVPRHRPAQQEDDDDRGRVLGDDRVADQGARDRAHSRAGPGRGEGDHGVGADEQGAAQLVAVQHGAVDERGRGDGVRERDEHRSAAVVELPQGEEEDGGHAEQGGEGDGEQTAQPKREAMGLVVDEDVAGLPHRGVDDLAAGGYRRVERMDLDLGELASGEDAVGVEAGVGHDGEEGRAGGLVRIEVAVAEALVARGFVVAVDDGRPRLDEGAGQGEAGVLVPGRRGDEVGVAQQQRERGPEQEGPVRRQWPDDLPHSAEHTVRTSSASSARDASAAWASGLCARRCSIWYAPV